MANRDNTQSTTQTYLDIFDITNNVVIMKDGSTSLILTVDAMNFGLLAEEEQDSIMYAYAGLLNSLNYTIQILIKSQTKDVTGYLNLIKEQEDATQDRTQQKRIQKYREFVGNLIRERNVLDKKFYVVIPAQPIELGLMSAASVIPGKTKPVDITSVDRSHILEKARNILEPKRDHLIAQFARIGLYSRQLETQEIIQLFYTSYNPEASEGQTIDESKSYTTPLVTAKVAEDSFMNIAPTPPAEPPAPATPVQPVAPVVPAPTPATPVAPAPVPTPEPVVEQPTPTGSYAPTQMPNNPVEPITPTPVTPVTPVVETPTETPMPPAPELPVINPAVPDPIVPKETEIKIEHPSEKLPEPAAVPVMPPVAEIS